MNMDNRHTLFLVFTLVAVAMLLAPLRALLSTEIGTYSYLYIVLIPLISGYLIFEKREVIFSNLSYSWVTSIPIMMIGIVTFFVGNQYGTNLNKNDYASLMTSSAIIFWIGAFSLTYGTNTLRKTLFPLIFLVFMVPIPSPLLDRIIGALQVGSAEVVSPIFKILGVPFVREGLVFHMSNISIEIAPQCSGINSTLALLIITILASHLFIRTGWKKMVLILCVFPIVLIKNAVRIVTLSLLGAYVDVKFLTHGFLHKSGGFVFYIPSLIILLSIAWLLSKSERKQAGNQNY